MHAKTGNRELEMMGKKNISSKIFACIFPAKSLKHSK